MPEPQTDDHHQVQFKFNSNITPYKCSLTALTEATRNIWRIHFNLSKCIKN